ncbi:hypothetical protein CPB84DRAFT_1809546, partial [Gymnopilus junonius]
SICALYQLRSRLLFFFRAYLSLCTCLSLPELGLGLHMHAYMRVLGVFLIIFYSMLTLFKGFFLL